MKVPFSVSFDEKLLEALKAHVAALTGRQRASFSQWVETACEERLSADMLKPGEKLEALVNRLAKSAKDFNEANEASKRKQRVRKRAA